MGSRIGDAAALGAMSLLGSMIFIWASIIPGILPVAGGVHIAKVGFHHLNGNPPGVARHIWDPTGCARCLAVSSCDKAESVAR